MTPIADAERTDPTECVPFPQTPEGSACERRRHCWLPGAPLATGLQYSRSRRWPWLRIVRLPRFGEGRTTEELRQTLLALRDFAQRRPVLRVHVEPWAADEAQLSRVHTACGDLGFTACTRRLTPRYTHLIDLARPLEDLFKSFHGTARRHILAPEKRGFTVKEIREPKAAGALAAILKETFDRTGGSPPRINWRRVLAAAGTSAADRVRIVGLYPQDTTAPDRFLAFAMAVKHGTVTEYAHAGSRRLPGPKLPLLYAPTWALMLWAQERGSRTWDFGGVASPREVSNPARAGIDAFKAYFQGHIHDAGLEYQFEPARVPSRLRSALAPIRR